MTDPLSPADDAATPLSAEEREGLIPSYITLRRELNAAEQENILEGEGWALRRRREVLDEGFLNQLHRRMFGGSGSGLVDTGAATGISASSGIVSPLSSGSCYMIAATGLSMRPTCPTRSPRDFIIGSFGYIPIPMATAATVASPPICWSCPSVDRPLSGAARTWSTPAPHVNSTWPRFAPPTITIWCHSSPSREHREPLWLSSRSRAAPRVVGLPRAPTKETPNAAARACP